MFIFSCCVVRHGTFLSSFYQDEIPLACAHETI
jgi:hypothetical protein